MKKVFLLIPFAFLIFICNLVAREALNISSEKKTAKVFSNPGDYFRSVTTGDWGATSTWESSPDGTNNWTAATLVPTSAAATISIRSTHTVTVSSNQDMDEVSVDNGGILFHSGGTLTVNNGLGDDIVVQTGGIFTLASSGNGPSFSGGSTTFISPSGILRLSASGLTGAGVGVNASNFTYSNASVLEYTLSLLFSTDMVTFFPNVNAFTIPIFRITNNIGAVGASNNTVFNGLFEANGNITFQNSGTKTFRNGITGTGNVNGSTSGKFIISGTTASLGGSGLLTLPTAGMDIGSSTTVIMVSDKAVTGNIALLSNALVILGNNNLTMTGTISGGSATSHIVTNANGKLLINNIGATPVFFPIGANTTSINQLEIYNGDNKNYGARVEIGINPSIRFPIAAINRTWLVSVSSNPVGPVNVNFYYATGDGNALFNYTTNVEQGFYTGVWNVINTGLTQMGGPPNYQVNTTVSSFAANPSALMILGNIPAILEPNNSITLYAQKQNEKTILNWTVAGISTIERFIAERSVDGRTFSVLSELPSTGFGFADIQPLPGLNYYRIKLIEKDGKITYSNVAVILNAAKGFDLISIAPNPIVNGNFKLNISAAQKMQMDIVITDMQGRVVQKQTVSMAAGINAVGMNINNLAKGTYQVYGNTNEGRSGVIRFVIQ